MSTVPLILIQQLDCVSLSLGFEVGLVLKPRPFTKLTLEHIWEGVSPLATTSKLHGEEVTQ